MLDQDEITIEAAWDAWVSGAPQDTSPSLDAPRTGQEKFGWAVEKIAPAGDAPSRFDVIWPDEYESKPDLEFWDDEKTLPKFPEGAVIIVYGDWGSHKTNTTLTMLLEAVERGARVVYSAGEGAYDVGKIRVPAHCRKLGITTRSLRGRFGIVPSIPLFANSADVNAFIEKCRAVNPHIVTLDTFATAIAGEDENSSKVASFLTANGPAGRIRDAFKCLVIILAHQGKDASKGIRGNSGIGGNIDGALHVDRHDSGGIKLTVEKMRTGGRDGFSIYFEAPPKGSTEVPVPVRISEAEYKRLTGGGGSAAKADSLEMQVGYLLRENGKVGTWKKGFDDSQMTKAVVVFERGEKPDDVDAAAAWQERYNEVYAALGTAARHAAWAKRLTDEGRKHVRAGGTKSLRIWFLPE